MMSEKVSRGKPVEKDHAAGLGIEKLLTFDALDIASSKASESSLVLWATEPRSHRTLEIGDWSAGRGAALTGSWEIRHDTLSVALCSLQSSIDLQKDNCRAGNLCCCGSLGSE